MKSCILKTIKLSLAFLKNREITAQTGGVNTTIDINKMLACDRIPMFLDVLMHVPCSKTYIISITLITFKMIHNALIVN